MFQNDIWGCGVHSYCLEQEIDVRELILFTCCLFPVEVNKVDDCPHALTARCEMRYHRYDLPCKRDGDTPVFEVAKPDIEYFYRKEIIDEIESIRDSLSDGLASGVTDMNEDERYARM